MKFTKNNYNYFQKVMVIKMVITLSGVTGVGKSYLKKEIQKALKIEPQVIVTTRQKRIGERAGIDKKFVDEKQFERIFGQ